MRFSFPMGRPRTLTGSKNGEQILKCKHFPGGNLSSPSKWVSAFLHQFLPLCYPLKKVLSLLYLSFRLKSRCWWGCVFFFFLEDLGENTFSFPFQLLEAICHFLAYDCLPPSSKSARVGWVFIFVTLLLLLSHLFSDSSQGSFSAFKDPCAISTIRIIFPFQGTHLNYIYKVLCQVRWHSHLNTKDLIHIVQNLEMWVNEWEKKMGKYFLEDLSRNVLQEL